MGLLSSHLAASFPGVQMRTVLDTTRIGGISQIVLARHINLVRHINVTSHGPTTPPTMANPPTNKKSTKRTRMPITARITWQSVKMMLWKDRRKTKQPHRTHPTRTKIRSMLTTSTNYLNSNAAVAAYRFRPATSYTIKAAGGHNSAWSEHVRACMLGSCTIIASCLSQGAWCQAKVLAHGVC